MAGSLSSQHSVSMMKSILILIDSNNVIKLSVFAVILQIFCVIIVRELAKESLRRMGSTSGGSHAAEVEIDTLSISLIKFCSESNCLEVVKSTAKGSGLLAVCELE